MEEKGFVKDCLIKETRAILGKVELSPILKKTNLGVFLKKSIYQDSKNWNLCKELNFSTYVRKYEIKTVGIMG